MALLESRVRRRRSWLIGFYGGTFLVGLVILALVMQAQTLAALAFIILLTSVAVGGSLLILSHGRRRHVRALAQVANSKPDRNPKVTRRARRLRLFVLGWSILLWGGFAALWVSGHPEIALAFLIGYAILSMLIPWALAFERLRRIRR